jgi:hypothetical protein
MGWRWALREKRQRQRQSRGGSEPIEFISPATEQRNIAVCSKKLEREKTTPPENL